MNNKVINNSCFFTGHRIISNDEKTELKYAIKNLCINLIEKKAVTDFITGGALGFDTVAALAILDLKKIYPHIKLHLYFPCTNQTARWRKCDADIWKKIKSHADDFKYIVDMPYISGCMQLRNKAMVDNALYGIAYCNKAYGGTYSTVKYAKEKNRIVYIIK
ncbi:MAG: SLOG family protein [Clostridia bacterium]|nr:SLOG family protein [Clostridia bacterium]